MAIGVRGQHRLASSKQSNGGCHAELRQPSAVLLLWLALFAMYRATAGVCNTVAYSACPSASNAAAALTGSNAQLPITNAAFSGVCNTATTIGYLLITDMGCHELAPTMPSGALVLSNGDARFGTLITNSADDKGADQGTTGTDTDMQAASTDAGYTQSLLDQVLLTFDITPTVSGNLAFQYVFGSEEYPEFAPSVGNPTSSNNDIFGFFIWSGSNTHDNVGLIPNTSLPVSIATVNAISNTQYFVPNTLGAASPKATEFDGFTTLLKTDDYNVTAGTTYRIKLGIADGGDATYDSVVWVKAGSVRFNIKDCVGDFVPNGPCSGACGGGSGILPEVYNITVPAQNGGNPCPIANGTTRSSTTCVNDNPCPVNCTATWEAVNGSCTGACGGGSGFTTEMWNITSPAMYGGSCDYTNGTTRATTTPCVNNDTCAPVDCVGSWVADGVCDGACGGGAGLLPEIYNVTVPAAYGGTNCSTENGTTQNTTACNNTDPCPVDCVGSWVVQNNTCDGECAGGNGTMLEMYIVTTEAQYGGQPCSAADNDTQRVMPCTNNDPCPVNCTYYWQETGNCTGGCSNGTGTIPEELVITSPGLYGGWCPGSDGSARSPATSCINYTPCPPEDCVGDWSATYNCNGTCNNGSGTGMQTFQITTPANYGGVPCNYTANEIRYVPCVNGNCCPVDCTGSWVVTGNCTGHCQGGTGTLTETWYVNVSTSCGGTCPQANNTQRHTLACVNNDICPPQDCVGSWVADGTCNGTCGGGAGILPEVYRVTVPAMYNGTECNVTDWTTRAITPCNNTYPCPIDCVGNWVTITGNCTGACQGGQGFVPERYNVTVPAQYGGVDCNYTNGAYRYQITCVNNNPCPPQNCQGIWVQNGSCTGGCGGQRSRGLLPERYIITVPAAYGGSSCPIAEGDTRMVTPCTNNNPCVNIPCNATWLTTGACNATCGGGTSHLPQRYLIYSPAQDNGTPCEAANNTLRQTVTCTNNTPCPVNCVGGWQASGPCNGTCNNGSGLLPEVFVNTTQAQYGGVNCTYSNGVARMTTPCVNYTPCPVNCVGAWHSDGACDGACGGGGGLLPERYTITTQARYGGQACASTDGATRHTTACNNTQPCPGDCVGHWQVDGACSGACNNGTGTIPEKYVITQPAVYGGVGCAFTNGTTRNTTLCQNPTPCPINCVGSWQTNGLCNGTCNNGSGLLPEVFVITTQAQHGGVNCSYNNGVTRMSTSCINSTPCPVNCVGAWHPDGACDGPCGGGSGLLPERYAVTTPALHGGQTCSHADGDTRKTTACTNTAHCPVNCTGQWQPNGTCSGACNNGTGVLPEKYIITQLALYGGANCSSNGGDERNVTVCVNSTPCPINCTGVFQQIGNCSGACNGGQGTLPEMFVITKPAQYGGANCTLTNGTTRDTTPCVTSRPCQPVNCVGRWTAYGPCSALCGGNTGFIPERFVVTTAAVDGGQACPATNGTTRYSTQCVNNTVCPYANVQIVQSPPVLPPLNMSSMNSTDIVIKGGNVSVTGVRVDALGASATSGGSSFTTDKIEASSNASANVKPRTAAFNGSLGFYTLGVLIDVLGEFELQRTMNWTWDTTWNAYITEVVIRGKFLLTREEIVNNVTVGIQHMDPKVSGYLRLYSAFYPGPGFSGTYDWAGKLEMSPDPFQEWDDTASLLLKNTTNTTTSNPASSSGRKMLRGLLRPGLLQAPHKGWAPMTATTPASSSNSNSSQHKGARDYLPASPDQPHRKRAVAGAAGTPASSSGSVNAGRTSFRVLLQSSTSTGQVPVQGRVAVREAMETTSGVGSGTAYLDESGDVMVVGPGPGPESNPNYIPPSPTPVRPPSYPDDTVNAVRRNPKLVTIVVAAIVAPAGLAAIVSALVAAGLFRRKKNREQQEATTDFVTKRARLHKHREGEHAGRQQQEAPKSFPWSRARNFDSSTDEQPPTLTEARLDLSEAGARRRPVHFLDEDSAGTGGTKVEHLAPGETGFGSLPGGQEAMVILPPRSDSADWTSLTLADPSRPSYTSGWRASINGMRSSLTGIANGFAQALRLRTSNTGGAYGVSHSAAAAFDAGVDPSGGSTLMWSSPSQHRAGYSRRAREHRMPTLPGSPRYQNIPPSKVP